MQRFTALARLVAGQAVACTAAPRVGAHVCVCVSAPTHIRAAHARAASSTAFDASSPTAAAPSHSSSDRVFTTAAAPVRAASTAAGTPATSAPSHTPSHTHAGAGAASTSTAAPNSSSSTPAAPATVFYDPSVKLTNRQAQVWSLEKPKHPLPLIADHGFLYNTTPDQLEGRNDMVKKALSTRTGATAGVAAFRRQELLRKFSPREFDTGSSRVQVAMLTDRINRLSLHLSRNKHDKPCKRSITALTVRRRKLLEYMMRTDFDNYRVMIQELGLRPLPVFHDAYLPKVRAETHKQVNERNRRLKNRRSRGHLGH